MTKIWFLYDNTTGIIQQHPRQGPNNPWSNPPSSWSVASFASTDTTAILAEANPSWYLLQGSTPALVLQPYWTLTATESSSTAGEYTITGTLNHPPSTMPSSATVSVAGGAISATVSSSGTTSTTIQLHPSVQKQAINVQISASGTVSGQTTINSGTPSIGLQLIPATSSTPAMVAPTGQGSRAYLRAFWMGLSPETQITVLTQALQNLMLTTSITNRLLTEKIIPMLEASSFSSLTLSSAESDAIKNWSTNVQANMVGWADLLDSSGNPIAPYKELQAQAPTVLKALQSYSQDVATLPNLG